MNFSGADRDIGIDRPADTRQHANGEKSGTAQDEIKRDDEDKQDSREPSKDARPGTAFARSRCRRVDCRICHRIPWEPFLSGGDGYSARNIN